MAEPAADASRTVNVYLSTTHAKNVSIDTALRELIANAFDAMSPADLEEESPTTITAAACGSPALIPDVELLDDSSTIVIRDTGKGITERAFVIGGCGSRRRARNGLGFKDAVAVLLRNGAKLTTTTAAEIMEPFSRRDGEASMFGSPGYPMIIP
jgi:hypothetical protein